VAVLLLIGLVLLTGEFRKLPPSIMDLRLQNLPENLLQSSFSSSNVPNLLPTSKAVLSLEPRLIRSQRVQRFSRTTETRPHPVSVHLSLCQFS
ncbi:hypothetical protein XENOCAPTIV_019053, partial [Xenoophorus captivus]